MYYGMVLEAKIILINFNLMLSLFYIELFYKRNIKKLYKYILEKSERFFQNQN
jgi:hypothetical protein